MSTFPAIPTEPNERTVTSHASIGSSPPSRSERNGWVMGARAPVLGVLLVLVALSSCGSTSTASATATTPATLAPATVGPAPQALVPRLSDSYVFVLPGVSVGYLDLRDGIAAATELVPNTSPPPAMCVLRQTEEDLTYTQSGTTLTVRARLIAPTPFTINPDGSISHEVPQADGTVTTNVFVSGSNVAYNAASARLASGYATCG